MYVFKMSKLGGKKTFKSGMKMATIAIVTLSFKIYYTDFTLNTLKTIKRTV